MLKGKVLDVSNGAITFCSNESFFSRQIFKLKVNSALKECSNIRENLKQESKLHHNDFNVNVLITDIKSNTIQEKYFAFKGYNSDGSLKPLKVYTLQEGKLININKTKKGSVLVIDLYEKSIYIHDYKIEDQYAEGYLVKTEKNKEGMNVILSNEKVKVFMKNTNTHHEYKNVIEFLKGYIL
jgi:predicted DNA-binding antitoxin AbrB/MazE fold protein